MRMTAIHRAKRERWQIGWLVVCLLLLRSGCFAADDGWWNPDWQYRRNIQFDTSAAGADIKENLSDVTILLRLHSGNFNFVNAAENGEDIRFVKADEKTLLKHHIELYDTLEEIALIWVQLPTLSGGTDQEMIRMYYGNKEAVGGQDSGGSYGPLYGAVYHFSSTTTPPKDATANKNDPLAFSGGQGLPAVIGNGVMFNGVSDAMTLKASPSLDMSGGFTFSAWVKIPAALNDAVLFTRKGNTAALTIGIEQTKVSVTIVSDDGQNWTTEKTADLPLQSWNHIAVTGGGGAPIIVYVNGLKIDWLQLPRGLPNFSGDMMIAKSFDGNRLFSGEIDEISIAGTPWSLDRVRAAFATQGADGKMIRVSQEMVAEGGGLPVFYLATVVKNITMDGWLVLGFMALLGAASWIVMLSKGISLYQIQKGDRRFKNAYDGNGELNLADDEKSENLDGSALYRLYQTGYELIKPWVKNPDETNKKLSRVESSTFKASLEKGLIDETHSLNSWLLILTMAVSGGPFLGLLGTVWGVMNTFAAMAEAGEANIMAIAPGIASALSTTVFGLLVAIPALFGYSYLSSKIKKITIDLTVFVDNFQLKIDQLAGEQ